MNAPLAPMQLTITVLQRAVSAMAKHTEDRPRVAAALAGLALRPAAA